MLVKYDTGVTVKDAEIIAKATERALLKGTWTFNAKGREFLIVGKMIADNLIIIKDVGGVK